MTPPNQAVVPALCYEDAPSAIKWLCQNLGFEEDFVIRGDGGRIEHAQLEFHGSTILLRSLGNHPDFPQLDRVAHHGSTNLAADSTEEVKELHDRATAAGATIVLPLEDTDYGTRTFTCADLEGNLWHIGADEAFSDPMVLLANAGAALAEAGLVLASAGAALAEAGAASAEADLVETEGVDAPD